MLHLLIVSLHVLPYLFTFFRIKMRMKRAGGGGDYIQADMTYCRIPDEEVIAGVVIVKDQHGYDAATQPLFCFFCVWWLFSLCVKVIPTLKKEKKKKERQVIENQPKHLCHYRLGPAILLCMENYISVYKLQEETYLYRWRRGGETGAKLLGVSRFIFMSSENRCLLCAVRVFV